jgi:hypothetical protein
MRKKLAMRRGGKVAKYAEGGRVAGQRPTENRARMAAEAAAGFDEEEDRILRRRAANRASPSLISNNPVGSNRAAGRIPVGAPVPMPLPTPAATAAPMEAPLPTPPIPPEGGPPPRRRGRPMPTNARSRRREMTADELNEREMTRLLNERSLAAAQAGRNMFRKGGKVGCK